MADIPKIRFKGFTEPWEQRKLGEMGSTFTGLSGKTKEDFGHGDAKFITYMNVFSNPIANLDMTEYVEIDSKQNCVKAGDVFFTTSSETPEEVGMSCVMPENADNIYLNSFCFGYRPTVEFDLNYLAYVLRAESFRKNMTFLAQGISRYNISKNKVMEIKISVPSLDEQNLVGAYFSNLDHLITLHQRKCDDTKELKKYMLQKMFPKNGEKFPEIRFKGFTEAWEQRKVTDLGEIYIGLVTTMTEHYTDQGHLLIRNSDIKDGFFEFGENPIYLDEEFSEQNKSRMHQLGDVITVHTGDIGTSAVIGDNEVNSIGFATIVTRPNQEVLDSDYFATYLNTDTHKQWAISMATGDGRSNYNLKDYTKLVVPIPQIKEQKKIAACIGNLNNLITLHQRKCDTLKELKKYMLQNMFPKKG